MYRTSNQAYGSRAPTVHEMPVSQAWKHLCVIGTSPGGGCDPGFLMRGGGEGPRFPTSQNWRWHIKSFPDRAERK